MLNRAETAVIRATMQARESVLLTTHGARRHGTVYHPTVGHIIGYNFGSHVRPDVAPIRVTAFGAETVQSYLARGGRIVTGAPKVATGAAVVSILRSRSTRIVTSRG